MINLPTASQERKALPIGTGVLDYFPLALAEVARVSKIGNSQHNLGEPLRWDKSKSQDESDAMIRHFLERDRLDVDGTYHAAKMAWRALAYLERLLEKRKDQDDTQPPVAHNTKSSEFDTLEFAPGGTTRFYPEENYVHIREYVISQLDEINRRLSEGCKYELNYDPETNESYLYLHKPTNPLHGFSRSFVVWGKVQRKKDGQRRTLQSGCTDSSQSQLTLWDNTDGLQSQDQAGGYCSDQRPGTLRQGS